MIEHRTFIGQTNPQNCRCCFLAYFRRGWRMFLFLVEVCVFAELEAHWVTGLLITNLFWFWYLQSNSLSPAKPEGMKGWRRNQDGACCIFFFFFYFKQCCESYELWFCPYFDVHMWGDFAKCENIFDKCPGLCDAYHNVCKTGGNFCWWGEHQKRWNYDYYASDYYYYGDYYFYCIITATMIILIII